MSVGVQRLREEPDRIRQGAIDKREDPAIVDRALEVDARRRRLQAESDTPQGGAQRGRASGSARRSAAARSPDGPGGRRAARRLHARRRPDRRDRRRAGRDRGRARGPAPAHPEPRRPRGPGRRRGGQRHGPHLGRARHPRGRPRPTARPGSAGPHWEIGEALDIIDNVARRQDRGLRVPGLQGRGARGSSGSLISWFLDVHTTEHGFTEVWPPAVVNTASARGTGQIPDKEDQMYVVTRDELYLVPTAEVPVTNLHRDEILEASDLPIRYAAYTPCFRREAGAAGKDTRGILRVHQFDKVEMVLFEKPDDSPEALEWMTAPRRGAPPAARPAVPRAADEHRRDGLRPAQEVRPGGLGAGRGALARGQLLLQLRRLPGPPHGDPLPPGPGREAGARPHAQRVRPRAGPDRRRDPGGLPGARRDGDRPGGAPPVRRRR